jgi:phosphoribosylformylglycinamidine synthase II
VNRDAIGFGMGAKPIANTYGFCFSDPDDDQPFYRGKDKTQPMLLPRRILNGVVAGVNSGGNCSGIPTPLGFVCFDPSYKGKPLVFVGTVGLIPKKVKGKSMIRKSARPGDYIVMVGGRVGLDGIHGATFSSEALTGGSPATAVQIGDPITQKKLSDALVKEARDQGLFTSITDNGAGGLSCSVAEMAKESNGCLVFLDRIPLKYPGLSPWQIWISESQERMTLSVPPKKWKKLHNLLTRRGVESSVIGKFTKTGNCVVKFENKTVMNISMKFLHDGLPKEQLRSISVNPKHREPRLPDDSVLTTVMEKIISRLNIAGYGFISSQYDHEVQGSSVIKPLVGCGLVNSDVAVVRPVLSSDRGIVLSQSLYPWYGEINPYQMAACSIDTAVRNVVAAGANPKKIALLDNFCWCSSKDPERLGELKEAVKACYDFAVSYQTPFISGKDSMFNDFSGFDQYSQPIKISIRPTLLISAIGIIDDVRKSVSMDFKIPGDLIYQIGTTNEELGASEYFAYLGGKSGKYLCGNQVPIVHLKQNIDTYKALAACIKLELLASAISVGRGGLGVALAKSAIAGESGIDVNIQGLPGKINRNDTALFSESQGRILVSINPKNRRKFEKILNSVPSVCLGKVTQASNFLIHGMSGKTVVSTDIAKLHQQYKSAFTDF